MRRNFLTLILFTAVGLLLASRANAQSRVESDNYEIQLPNFNSGAGIPTSSNYRLDSTIGQTAPGLFSSTGYRVRSGFQYIHTIIPFSFSVSDISINFGNLIAEIPVTQQSTLTVKAGGAGGYSVKAQENNPMESDSSEQIPDTTCDTGLCSETNADPWTQSTKYGFGFNMNGDDIPSDFVDTTYYRQFSDASSAESPAVIMNKSEVTWDYPNNAWPWESIATITYKVNVSGDQSGGTYRNIVTFTAIPSF
jgi:hypothetical protein